MNEHDAVGAAGLLMFACVGTVYLGILTFVIAGQWKAFVKAGKPGWAAIVPFYNLIVMVEIAGKPTWWVFLYFVPIANLFAVILTSLSIAKSFGKSEGFGIGLAFLAPIFWPILGFGSAQYVGPMGGTPGGWNGGVGSGGGFGPPPGGGFGGPPAVGPGQPGGWGGPPAPPSY